MAEEVKNEQSETQKAPKESKAEQEAPAAKPDRYKGLDESLADELRKDEIEYFRMDLPVPFHGFLLYPATVRDYEKFASASACLTLDKNKTPEVIRITNLDYLVSKLNDKTEGPMWSFRLNLLIEVVFHLKNGLKCKKCGNVIEYHSDVFTGFLKEVQDLMAHPPKEGEEFKEPKLVCDKCGNEDQSQYTEMVKIVKGDKKHFSLLVDEKPITSQMFNELREIIMYQNSADYQNDSWVDPDVKADYEERLALEQKANAGATASLERKIVGLSVASNYKLAEIYDMTIRKFAMALGLVDDLINYKIMRSAMMSGMVSFPKDFKLEHWLYKTEKDMYGDGYKTTEQAQQFAAK